MAWLPVITKSPIRRYGDIAGAFYTSSITADFERKPHASRRVIGSYKYVIVQIFEQVLGRSGIKIQRV